MLIDPLENRNAFRPDGPVKHHRNSMQVRTENETRRIEFQLPNKTSCYQSMPEKYQPHELVMGATTERCVVHNLHTNLYSDE